ncbi:MAG: sugar phosphate isomerase/epimerase [Candidatus Thorarchaeota archaeon]|nr:sugar phosphate isomerase/epimerase [Candidatus Thorarchaeota archaeon]
MRFGIVPLEFEPAAELIIGNGTPDFSRFDVVELIHSALHIKHIEVIELTLDVPHLIPGSLPPETVTQLINLREETGCTYTAHLPLWSVELASPNEYIRKGSVESTVAAVELAEPLEPEYYVLHSTGALAAEFSRLGFPQGIMDVFSAFMAGYSAQSIEEILEQTNLDPRRLAVENVEFPFSVTRQVIDEYDCSICFDTGHLLTKFSGDEPVVDFYREHRERIVEIHLNDGSYRECDGVAVHEDHLALGDGEMPVQEFVSEIYDDGFDGPLIFELTAQQAKRSLDLIEQLIPEALT